MRYVVPALILGLTAVVTAHAQGPPRARVIPVKVAPIVERPVVDKLRFIATVEPSIHTTVGAEVSGRVTKMPVREGDHVVAGKTVLARLDPTPREIQLREGRAAVAKAREEFDKLRRGYREEEVAQRAAEAAEQKAILDRAEQDYRRAERLHKEEIISLAELQRFQSEYRAVKQKHQRALDALRLARAGPRQEEIAQAQAELSQAEARAERIEDEIRRTTILAPITGFVVKKHVDVGAWVDVGDRVADLIALDPVFITGPVGEREIRKIRAGQKALITLDAYPGRTFRGRVSAVVPGADATSRTFPVKVTVLNPDGLLKAGMFARVGVRTGKERTGLFVPRDAMVRRGGREFIFVVNSNVARLVRVETASEVGGLVEVRGSGLSSGQMVVTLGNEFLQPGMKVQPTQ
ncbi:MAG: efflux RND transporter periplasmic adaptor subunit [Candidatus Methylomirabilia bacterium]